MSRDLENRFGLPLACKFAPVDDSGLFEGYASTFGGPPDTFGDVVAPGAFKQTLSEHRGAGTMPAMLWAHDQNQPIGKWLDMSEDGVGLKAVGRLTLGVERAREARALMKDGALGLSIGFRTRDASKLDGDAGRRMLKNVNLFETSAVAMPANSRARITAVKSGLGADEITDPRAFENFLREAGFSRAFAKAVTAAGFKTAAAQLEHDRRGSLAEFIKAQTIEIDKLTRKVKQ